MPNPVEGLLEVYEDMLEVLLTPSAQSLTQWNQFNPNISDVFVLSVYWPVQVGPDTDLYR